MSIHAPYNFVPLSKFIFLPPWADQVSHDVPFSDGLSGTLELELTCHTPTLVGGRQIKATQKNPGIVEFCKDPQGQAIIPGSTLKGMLSNVLEIASFAKFNRLADKRYSVRDISSSESFYFNEFQTQPKGGMPGWLKYNKITNQWTITPCEMVRLHQQDIINHFNISTNEWIASKNNAVRERYRLLKGLNNLQFNKEGHKTKGAIGKIHAKGEHQGVLVMTGQPKAAFNKNKKAKKWEFIFYNSSEQSLPLSANVIRDFQFIHSESDEWKYWQELGKAYDNQGVPIFYQKGNGGVTSLGLAYLYRLAYKNSTHEAVQNTHPSHTDNISPDLPALIFGQLDNEGGNSLRGRVNINAARPTSSSCHYKTLGPTVLIGPKPTYYPAYMRQTKADEEGLLDNAKDYQTMMSQGAELAGYKRYPAHQKADVSTPKNKSVEENNKTKVELKPISEGTSFKFSIRLHNLKEVELGALLWCLDFGGKTNTFHGLGMGKPYGLGRVSLALTDHKLKHNQEGAFSGEQLLEKCRKSFTKLMEDAYQTAYPGFSWAQSPQLNELISMARPRNHGLKYMALDDFKTNKSALKTLVNDSGEPIQHPENEAHIPVIWQANSDISLLSDTEYQEYLQAKVEKRQREEAKANASEEDALIIEFDGLVADFHQKNGTSSAKKNAQKKLEALIKIAKEYDYTPEQQNQVIDLAESIKLPEKFITKFKNACKREVS